VENYRFYRISPKSTGRNPNCAAIIRTMQTLRSAHLIARFVLVWFALSIGVAIASPMVNPQSLQLICSGSGSMKVVSIDASGKATTTTSHTLDCPLCASISAPPPLEIIGFSAVAPRTFSAPVQDTGRFTPVLATPPPARGPPSLI
jgi:hypothetical protein